MVVCRENSARTLLLPRTLGVIYIYIEIYVNICISYIYVDIFVYGGDEEDTVVLSMVFREKAHVVAAEGCRG